MPCLPSKMCAMMLDNILIAVCVVGLLAAAILALGTFLPCSPAQAEEVAQLPPIPTEFPELGDLQLPSIEKVLLCPISRSQPAHSSLLKLCCPMPSKRLVAVDHAPTCFPRILKREKRGSKAAESLNLDGLRAGCAEQWAAGVSGGGP